MQDQIREYQKAATAEIKTLRSRLEGLITKAMNTEDKAKGVLLFIAADNIQKMMIQETAIVRTTPNDLEQQLDDAHRAVIKLEKAI